MNSYVFTKKHAAMVIALALAGNPVVYAMHAAPAAAAPAADITQSLRAILTNGSEVTAQLAELVDQISAIFEDPTFSGSHKKDDFEALVQFVQNDVFTHLREKVSPVLFESKDGEIKTCIEKLRVIFFNKSVHVGHMNTHFRHENLSGAFIVSYNSTVPQRQAERLQQAKESAVVKIQYAMKKNKKRAEAARIAADHALRVSPQWYAQGIKNVVTYGITDARKQHVHASLFDAEVDLKELIANESFRKAKMQDKKTEHHVLIQGNEDLDFHGKALVEVLNKGLSQGEKQPLDGIKRTLEIATSYLNFLKNHLYNKIVVELKNKLGQPETAQIDLAVHGIDGALVADHAQKARNMLTQLFFFSEPMYKLATWLKSLVTVYKKGIWRQKTIILAELNNEELNGQLKELDALIRSFAPADEAFVCNACFGPELFEAADKVLAQVVSLTPAVEEDQEDQEDQEDEE